MLFDVGAINSSRTMQIKPNIDGLAALIKKLWICWILMRHIINVGLQVMLVDHKGVKIISSVNNFIVDKKGIWWEGVSSDRNITFGWP